MNLFLLLGQLGLSWDLSGQPLLAVGTVYDPFVLPRAGRVHPRRLLGVAVRDRRYALRRDARARGRSAPVDHHRVDRAGAAGRHVRRARLRHSAGLAAVRRVRADRRRPADGTHGRARTTTAPTTSGSRRDRSTRRRSTRRGPGSATRCCGARCWPGRTGSWTPRRLVEDGGAGGAPRRIWAPCCPRS